MARPRIETLPSLGYNEVREWEPTGDKSKTLTAWLAFAGTVVAALGVIIAAKISAPPIQVVSPTPAPTVPVTATPIPPTPDTATDETSYFEIAPEGAPPGSHDRLIIPDGHPEFFSPFAKIRPRHFW